MPSRSYLELARINGKRNAAYRRMALRYHPDANNSRDAETIIK